MRALGITRFFAKRMLKKWKEHDERILAGQGLPEGVIEDSDIPYVRDGSREHWLDVCYPANAVGKLPVILDIHGGGFIYGDKALNRAFCHHLALRGFTVVNMNYRLALYDAKVTDQLRDVLSAAEWVSQNMDAYPADPSQLYLVGDSAGGALAVMAALIANSERLQALYQVKPPKVRFRAISVICGMMGLDRTDFKFRSLYSLCFGRGYSRREEYRNMIFGRIPEMKDLPPVFLMTSEEDALSPMTLEFEKILQKHPIKYQLKHYPQNETRKLGHIFSVQYPEYEESQEFLNEMALFFQSQPALM